MRLSSPSVKIPQTPDAATDSGVFLLKQSDEISLILTLFVWVKQGLNSFMGEQMG